jgi:hypothetical protein
VLNTQRGRPSRRGAQVGAGRGRSPAAAGGGLRPYADVLIFVERLEPPSEHAEDLDSGRLVGSFQAGDGEAPDARSSSNEAPVRDAGTDES